MKKYLRYFTLALIVLFSISSCTKTEFDDSSPKGNDFIKTELLNNKIITNFKYNDIWKITECEYLNFYFRYTYDNSNRLIKKEAAVDLSQRTELMTAKNSTTTSYSIFKYDIDGKLFEIENYSQVEDESTLRTKNSLVYDNGNIVRSNFHLPNGDINKFNVYEYDDNRNVINLKQYSYNFSDSNQPKLVSETTFKHDNKRNPFRIFEEEGSPGIFTNTNNEIEYTTTFEETPGTNGFRTTVITYEYNENDYPIIETQGSKFEYTYFENVP